MNLYNGFDDADLFRLSSSVTIAPGGLDIC
jgi:hypothetical protein